MREIKFRAFDKKRKLMFCALDAIYFDDTPTQIGALSSLSDTTIIPIEDVILMQYTGLKDKNGVEIYEGDRLGSRDSVGVVVFGSHIINDMNDCGEQDASGWHIRCRDGSTDNFVRALYCYTVIGNIYETK